MILSRMLLSVVCFSGIAPLLAAEPASATALKQIKKIDLLPPSAGNPRNSEGDFLELTGGRILFVYTHFTGGSSDGAAAHLASRVSDDGGLSWSQKDAVVVSNNAGQNVMSVSLLRLSDGRIALFYLQKDSNTNCRPIMRTSSDDARTWSEPQEIIANDETGYYVLNNDRAIQLTGGRILLPLAQHYGPAMPKWDAAAKLLCYYSDDNGTNWNRGEIAVPEAEQARVVMQEPGLVELPADRLLMFARTNAGSQFTCESKDGGVTWSAPRPSSLISPLSPASIERIPTSDTLIAIWNDHRDVSPELRGKRTPLVIAVSHDGAKTWRPVLTLEDDTHGWYCYTAVAFTKDDLLLGYCAGDRRENNGLAATRITVVPRSLFDEK